MHTWSINQDVDSGICANICNLICSTWRIFLLCHRSPGRVPIPSPPDIFKCIPDIWLKIRTLFSGIFYHDYAMRSLGKFTSPPIEEIDCHEVIILRPCTLEPQHTGKYTKLRVIIAVRIPHIPISLRRHKTHTSDGGVKTQWQHGNIHSFKLVKFAH